MSHVVDGGARSRESHAVGSQDGCSRPALGEETEEHVLRLDLLVAKARGFRVHGFEPGQVVRNSGHRHLLRVGAKPG